MRILLDNNLSVRLTDALIGGGLGAVHVRALGLAAADDHTVLAAPAADDRVLVSADADLEPSWR